MPLVARGLLECMSRGSESSRMQRRILSVVPERLEEDTASDCRGHLVMHWRCADLPSWSLRTQTSKVDGALDIL